MTTNGESTEPVLVGEISAAQAREIKGLNDFLARLEEEAIHAQRVLMVAQLHKREYLRLLLVEREIDPQGTYDIDPDSGRIMHMPAPAQVPATD